MVDPQPAPILPENPAENPPDPELLAMREAELAKVSQAGQERLEREETLQESLERKRLEEEARARKAITDLETGRREKHNAAKKFRSVRMATEREIAADKERQKKLEEQAEKRKEQQQAEKKKQDDYFHLIRQAAGLKIAREHRENELKRLIEAERKKATSELNAAVEAAIEAERLAGQEIEQEIRARKSLVDIDTRAALYKWESEERMKMREAENEMHRKIAEIQLEEKSALESQRKKASVELAMRNKHRHVDTEMASKKQAIEFEDRRRRTLIDTEAQERRVDATRERQHAIRRAELRYGDRLNEIEREYVTKHYDRKR